MTVDDLRLQARRELEALGISMESAAFLVHDRPPGGWGSLATHDQLRAEVAGLASELRSEMRDQTWQLAKLVAGAQGIVVVAIAAIGAVLRFA